MESVGRRRDPADAGTIGARSNGKTANHGVNGSEPALSGCTTPEHEE